MTQEFVAETLDALCLALMCSALAALKKLTDEGVIIREGSGRNTFYYRADSK